MTLTKQKTRKRISNLSLDIEIVNPIESKNLFGGCEYSYCNCSGNESNWNSSPSPQNWDFPKFDNYNNGENGGGSYSGHDWQQYDNNYDNNGNYIYDTNGDGISDENEILIQNYPGENLTFNEKIWLLNNLHHLSNMIENKDLAETAGRNQHNGVFDALRHALWSALDAFDLGGTIAESFHTLHETEHWNDVESPSDLNNNSWGYQWTLINGNAQNNMNQFNIDFNAAVASGEITIIP